MSTLRNAWERLYRLLTSARVALWLMISWVALLLVWVVPFIATGQPEATVTAIARDWLPFRAVYVLVALVSLVCALQRFLRDRKRDWERTLTRRYESDSDRLAHSDFGLEQARTALLARRFKVTTEDESSVVLTRNRCAVYGGALFHAGIALVAAALVVHGATVSSASFELIEGQSVADSFGQAGSPKEKAALYRPLEGIVLQHIDARFFGPYLLFERLDATVTEAGKLRELALARPLWIDPVTNLSLQDFDVAPRFVVEAEGGSVAEDTTVAMDLFPPGGDRPITLYSAKANLNLRLYTDYTVRDGRPVSGSFNLEDVKFLTTVVSNVAGVSDRIVARKTIGVGDVVTVNDFKVRIEELKTVGTFRVTRAPALPFVLAATIIACAGLAARLVLRRIDVLLTASSEGVAYVAYEDVFGRAWGERYIARLLTREDGSR